MALRELPCPVRIIDDFGGAFAMGCIGGCILYFIRGCYYSPKKERLFGGLMLMKKRSPILGGSFAIWGGIFSSSECALIHFRQKEDYINPTIAGFITGGLLAIRAGTRIAFKNAIIGSVFLGCIQLVEIGVNKYQKRSEMKMQQEYIQMQKKQYLEQQKQHLRKTRPDLFQNEMSSKDQSNQIA